MYEVMTAWETWDIEGEPAAIQDFADLARGRRGRVLPDPRLGVSARTRLEREFDPEAVRRLKENAGDDPAVAGPDLAGQAIEAGLVDEYRLFLAPAIVGGGKQMLPGDLRVDLELRDQRRFDSGFVFVNYTAGSPSRRRLSGGRRKIGRYARC